MAENQIPSKDQADEGTLAGAFRSIFAKLLQGVDGMLPAQVLAYDRNSNTATVRALVSVLTTDNQTVQRAQVAQVPVLALGGGGFVVNFPIKAGDKGWIEASDRDISLFRQRGDEAQPNSVRMHSFEDGRFIPDVFGAFTVDAEDMESAMVIQSIDGTVKIALDADEIRVKAPKITNEATDTLTLKAAHMMFDCNDIKGTAPGGGVNLASGATIGGINFGTHKHTGVQTGGGTTGNPTA